MFFFFFNDTATTEIYTLSLHDALPILKGTPWSGCRSRSSIVNTVAVIPSGASRRSRRKSSQVFPESIDRKSTRLNSSHLVISYAVFCLKKKKNHDRNRVSF